MVVTKNAHIFKLSLKGTLSKNFQISVPNKLNGFFFKIATERPWIVIWSNILDSVGDLKIFNVLSDFTIELKI